MNTIRKLLYLAVLLLLITGIGRAQFFSDAMSPEALRPFRSASGFGAAAFSLQHNSLIAGDISSTQSNPAFLVNTTRPKASLSANYLNHIYQSALIDRGTEKSSESTTFYTDYFGFAYPVSVYQGTLVLAISYEPSAYYSSSLHSNGTVTFSEGDVAEDMDIQESGSMNTLRLAGAVEFLPNLNLGLSLNFFNGNRSYESIKSETDINNIYSYSQFQYLEAIKPEYHGANLDMGMTYQSEYFKFGIRLSSPLKMHIYERSEFSEDYSYDNSTVWDTTEYYNIEYTSRYPWEVAPSFAIKIGALTLGADLIVHNWQDIKVDQLSNDEEINRDLYWNLRPTTDVGVSLAIPLGKTISTRFAYRRVPSPYAEFMREKDEIHHLFGAGVETILMKSLILGCSYQRVIGSQVVSHPYFSTPETTVYSSHSFTNDRLSISLAILL